MTVRGSIGRAHVGSRIVAGALLVGSAPALLLGCLAIKLSSKGPVLFRAPRVGKSGQVFTMLKLRTMHPPGSEEAPRITGGRDARVFPAGRWLRRMKIDELPQLVNIIRGDMVLVGPRPEDPSIVADCYTPDMLRTLNVAPGLTSPGSLDYFAGEVTLPLDPAEAERLYLSELLPLKIALDLVYIQNQSWRYDLGLVVRTVAAMIGVRDPFPERRDWERLEARTVLCSADLEGLAPAVRESS